MFTPLETALLALVHTLPVEWFVFVASIVEEIIAPIPSPTVMMLAGSFASLQSYGAEGLILLACIGAMGKTFGALVVYAIAYRAEDFVLRHFGKFFEVTESEIHAFGAKIGTGVRGYFMLTLFRALPIVPSSLVSVGSGVLKIPLSIFIVSAFFGTIIRDGFYLYAGYVGTQTLGRMVAQSTHIESLIEYGVGLCVLAGLVYVLYRRRASRNRV
jgi:membrane protein DedA with SNARE-associated domain